VRGGDGLLGCGGGPKNNTNRKDWECPGCRSLLSKSPSKASGALRVERAQDTVFDRCLGETVTQARQVPVLINYLAVGKQRFDKRPDDGIWTSSARSKKWKFHIHIQTIDDCPEGLTLRQPGR
jgi:hypothetical protein